MKIKFYNINEIDNNLLKFAVIATKYQNKWVCGKNKNEGRYWEMPGGHREGNESILNAAQRELFEESGALKYTIEPVCVYSITIEEEVYGMLFFAEVQEFGNLPESEIEKIDFFDELPSELSFPEAYPRFIEYINLWYN